MPREREPRADRECDEGDGEEGEHDRAAREAREGNPLPAQRVELELRPRRERDQRDRRFFHEPERVHFLAPHESEPRGADGEPDQQVAGQSRQPRAPRSEQHTSELQSRENLVCRLLLEKKKKKKKKNKNTRQ